MNGPLIVPWHGRQLRVRHDDPRMSMYSGSGQKVCSAILLASVVDGLRLVLTTALGDHYRVKVPDDGSVVALWRRI